MTKKKMNRRLPENFPCGKFSKVYLKIRRADNV